MAKKAKSKTKVKAKTKAPKAPKTKAPTKKVGKIAAKAAKIGGAVTKAVTNFAASLGAMKVDPDLAADQMEELGTLLEDVAKAKVVADEKASDAKTAKGTYESKVNLLLEKLRGFTHPKALPLFDTAQAEKDLVDMTTAPADPDAGTAAEVPF